jgi:hypothetical protein
MEYFFKRLEGYIKVKPTAAMKDVIVKIMVEVISILGIVTKEIRQGRTSTPFPVNISPKPDRHAEKYIKKLFGMNALMTKSGTWTRVYNKWEIKSAT